ncbi:beta strand repeat-containing protein [Pseudobacter ginsenosidimutans]|uniref:Uncharacterized protein n=1 Tax=Pseudobacter ginsenosidimutans TaxID=661488 RepID=A0A4Q7N0S8_9BACT|nr:hypothetical protein [Pseudobacter ginsenosidimutans]RZS75200.1 hypothetical protein EV199_1062 [Pseudobacter ginsenosidimutans]
MKQFLLAFTALFLIATGSFAQAPGLINYQGVARNAVGNVLANVKITLRLSIRDNSAAGPVVYSETRSLTTNTVGLFNVQMGSPGATNVSGTIAGVNWATGSKYIQVEIDPAGGNAFTTIGTSQLASVPYALTAGSGSPVGPAGGALTGTYPNPQLAAGAVNTNSITNGSITLNKLAAGVIPTSLPPNGAAGGALTGSYPNPMLGVNSVNTIQLVDGSVTQAKLGPGVVLPPGGAAGGALTGTYPNPGIAANAVTSTQIADNAVTNSKIANGAVGTTKIADGSVSNPKLADNSVGTNKILDANVTTPKLADGSVTLAKIAPGVIPAGLPPTGAAGGSLAGTYPNPTIAANAVTTAELMDGAVVAAKLADGSVVTIKLADAAVTTNKIADANVTTPKLADGSVTLAKIAPGVIPAGLPPTGPAGGDLSGSYPNPLVAQLQGRPVSNVAPAVNQFLRWNGAAWAPAAGGGGGSLSLPYAALENDPNTLFSITNDGDGTSVEGVNNTTTSSIAAVRGIVSSTSPGGFSSGVRGVNNGTGGLGVGVWGSQNGSGWGVYGVTPNGLGVYGNSSANGYGVYANSNTGTGLQATSNNGIPASIDIFNNANNNSALVVNSVGNGTVVNVTTTGNGAGVRAITNAGFALHGITSAVSSAGVIGDNNGGGEAVVGRTTSDIAGAVVGRNDGGGYGVRGFIATNTASTAVGVLGQVGLNNSTGRAGRFENFNQSNTEANILEVASNSNGNIPDNTLGNASSFFLDNTNSVGAAVRAEVNTIFGNFGAAGVFGISSGTGGRAGLFYASNPSGNGASLIALTDGNGNAITANAGKDGNGVETNIDGAGTALYAWVPTFSEGRAGRFEIYNEDNDNEVITVKTVGNGTAGNFMVDRTTGTSPAVMGEVNSMFANFGTAGIYGRSSGTGGYAGLFYSSNPGGNGPAILALTEGSGNGITANAGGTGDGVEASCDGTGNAISGFIPNFGTGKAGRFANFNNANGQPVVHVSTTGTGSTLLVNHQGPSGNIAVYQSNSVNVARINKAGRGFFNGGTQNSGADVAESFAVTGSAAAYEAGDVLVIATDADRTVEKSSTPYSTLVAGVYATKPGVLLTEKEIDEDLSGEVPMGVIGVIPTKVCLEGGAIKRGDLLVTSSIAGVAMKADPDKVKVGQVIGKALQDYNAEGTGKIKVLVSIK